VMQSLRPVLGLKTTFLRSWSWPRRSWSWKNKWSWFCNLVVLLHHWTYLNI